MVLVRDRPNQVSSRLPPAPIIAAIRLPVFHGHPILRKIRVGLAIGFELQRNLSNTQKLFKNRENSGRFDVGENRNA